VSTRNHEFVVHHVLVALDASTHSLAALRVAAELAAEAKAELVGLYVEDIRLLRLAKAPRAREVLYPAAQQRPLNSATMEERFQAQAEQARRALASQASHAQVRWSFRVVRGEVSAEVLAAASEADVLVLGKTGWSVPRRMHLGSTALAATHNSPGSLLLVQSGVATRRQVLVFDAGSPSSARALLAGARLTPAYGNRLVVLITPDAAGAAETEASAWLKREHETTHVHFHRLGGSDVLSIGHAVQAEGGGILVVAEDDLTPAAAKELLRHLHSPVLLER